MDTIPQKEFVGIFGRTSDYVNMKGCITPDDINNRIKTVEKKMLEVQHKAQRKGTVKRWRGMRKHLHVLRKSDLGSRIIYEAVRNPRGYVSLVLTFGKKRANEIMLERAKQRIGRQRLVIRRPPR